MRIRFSTEAILPLAAAGLFAFAVSSVIHPAQGRTDPLILPPASPYLASVAGVGVVEPESETIAIATELPGVIREVLVGPGDQVEAGAPLFRLDSRALEAARAEAAAEESAASAALTVAEVNLADEKKRLAIIESVPDKRAVSLDERDRARFAVKRADAARLQAKAMLDAASARVASIEVDLARQIIAAPIAGEILSVDARPGEYAAAGPLARPLMTMGATDRLHLRVEIDESDFGKFSSASPAVATPRGDSLQRIPLEFIRVEPEATPKRVLAGGSERVDSRVVEIVYALKPGARAIVGQRFDVYINVEGAAHAATAAS